MSEKKISPTIWVNVSNKEFGLPWISVSSNSLRLHMSSGTQDFYIEYDLPKIDLMIASFESVQKNLKIMKKTLASLVGD